MTNAGKLSDKRHTFNMLRDQINLSNIHSFSSSSISLSLLRNCIC